MSSTSNFLLNINWAFGLSKQSSSAMKEVKLGMEDIQKQMENQEKLYEGNKLKADDFYESLINNTNKHIDSIKNPEDQLTSLLNERYNKLRNEGENAISAASKSYEMLRKSLDFYGITAEEVTNKLKEGKLEDLNLTKQLGKQYEQLQRNLDKYHVTGVKGEEAIRIAQATSLASMEKLKTSIDSIPEQMINNGVISSDMSDKMSDSLLKVAANAKFPEQAISEISAAMSRLNNAELGSREHKEALNNLVKIKEQVLEIGNVGPDNMEKYANSVHRVAKRTNKATESTEKLRDTISQIGGRLKSLVSGPWSMFLGAVGVFAAVNDAAQAHTQVTRDIVQMNLRASESAETLADKQGEYLSAIRETGRVTSTSLREVSDVYNSLGRARVTGTVNEMQELAETGLRMEYAFGLSRGASTDLLRNLKLVGGLGTTQIESAANAMAEVQQSMGLTAEEATEAAATIGTVVSQMTALGGEVRNIEIVTEEISKMTAAFNMVGLSASEASGMINKLMDPDQITQNTLLYRKMGMSVQDAFAMMSGEGRNMENMTENMVGIAKDLTNQYGQNPLVLKRMAEMHGMSYEQVQRLSQLNQEDLETMREENALQEQAAAAREGMNDALVKLGNQLNIILQGVVIPLVEVFSSILGFIVEKVVSPFNEWIAGIKESNKALGGFLEKSVGIVTIFTFLAGPILAKLLGGLGGIGSILGTIVGGPLVLLKKGFGAVASKIGLAKKTSAGFGDSLKQQNSIMENQAKLQGAKTEKLKAMANVFKSMRPAQILAIGAAIVLIAFGIKIVINSITDLVKVVGEADLAFSQLAGVALILLPVFGGFLGMMKLMPPIIKAIGKAGTQAAIGILAVGAAFFMMGVGVGLAAWGVSKLVEAFNELDSEQIAGALNAIIILIISLTTALLVMGIIGYFVGPAILAVGAAFLMMGAGVMLASVGIAILLDVMSRLGAEAIGPMIAMIGELTTQIFALSGAITLLAVGMAALTIAALAFSIAAVVMMAAAVAFVAAIVVMTTMIPFLWLLGKATDNVSENIFMMGQGMKWMGDSAGSAKTAINELKEAIKGFEVPEGVMNVANSFGYLGIVAKMFGEDILKFGTGILNLGIGTKELAANSENLKNSISEVKTGLNELKNVDLDDIINIFTQLGEATSQVAKNFDLMGKGVDLMARGLATVVEQLESMIGVLSSGDLSGLADNFNSQMDKINNNMAPSPQAGPQVQSMIETNERGEASVRGEQEGQPGSNAIVGELQQANVHLGSMDGNVKQILDLLKDNSDRGSATINSKTEINVGR